MISGADDFGSGCLCGRGSTSDASELVSAGFSSLILVVLKFKLSTLSSWPDAFESDALTQTTKTAVKENLMLSNLTFN